MFPIARHTAGEQDGVNDGHERTGAGDRRGGISALWTDGGGDTGDRKGVRRAMATKQAEPTKQPLVTKQPSSVDERRIVE